MALQFKPIQETVFLDKSRLDALAQDYNLNPTPYTSNQIIGNLPEAMIGIDGATVPAFVDRSGNAYVVTDKDEVYNVQSKPDYETRSDSRNGGRTNGGGSVGTNGNGFTMTPDRQMPLPPPPSVPPGGFNGNGRNGMGSLGSGKIYTPFTFDDIVPNQQEIVTRALWSENKGLLTTFFTSSEQTDLQKRYYYEIYNKEIIEECSSEPQFSIAYGHRLGSGSADSGGQINDTPTRAIYGQYKLLCLDSNEERFVIDGSATDSIYVININRARMLEYIDEGNIEINIHPLSGSEFLAGGGTLSTHTGSNVELGDSDKIIRLIDDSKINPATINQKGEVYNIVSGTIEDGVYNPSNPHIYGQLFKRKGIIVLDGNKLDVSASFATVTEREVDGDNAFKLFTAISGAALYDDGSGDLLGFAGRGAERVKSSHYFVRVKNGDYNFSNNPTFVTGTLGDLRHPDMYTDPKTYITAVGLYNERKDLIAIAKLSQAVRKSFKEEALIKIKLDF